MKKKILGLISLYALTLLWLSACSSVVPTAAPTSTVVSPTKSSSSFATAFETKSNSGGSVDIDVTPKTLDVGQVMAFQISMNTHSVDLSDDMTQIVSLRDDQGKEYTPTAWEGAGPGGHHRSGVIKFAALTRKPRSVDLIIKGLAKVSERTFHWDVP